MRLWTYVAGFALACVLTTQPAYAFNKNAIMPAAREQAAAMHDPCAVSFHPHQSRALRDTAGRCRSGEGCGMAESGDQILVTEGATRPRRFGWFSQL